MSTTDIFRANIENSLDEHFPKRKCKERSGGLMLFATAIMEHERVMCRVRKHMGIMLGSPNAQERSEAKAFYLELTK